jgi:dTDP-4-amino-4,6-dideoxygalactose transaminase
MKIKFLDLHKNIENIKKEINKKINNVITNTSFIMGPELKDFEINFAKYNNSKYCLGVGNGTDALEIAIKSLDLPEDSEIITQSNTFVATCLGVLNNKYKLRLVDCFEKNFMMDYTQIEDKITPKTKAIIVVHLYGHSADMDKIMELAKKYNLFVIEDCAQAHGCLYKNQKVGTFGDIGCFSFYPGKNLGAFGDAGGIITSNDMLYNKMKLIRNIGSKKKYHHEILGRNSRMDTIQAAVLDVKLKYLEDNNIKRRNVANIYFELLKNVKEIELPKIEDYCVPVYHLFVIKSDDRDNLQKYLKENGIDTIIHYPIAISELEAIKDHIIDTDLDVSIKNSKKILSLPMYPELEEKEIKYICNNVRDFYLKNANKK